MKKSNFVIFIKNELSLIVMSTFTAILRKDENMYVAECPEVGTASQGKTIEQAIDNLKEATELYLKEFPTRLKTFRFRFRF